MKLGLSILSIFILIGCQKGEEDPAISLVSRKARLTGTWDLVEMNATENQISQSYVDGVLTTNIDDTIEFSYDYTMEMTFNRDGDYERNEESNFPEDTSVNRGPYDQSVIENGDWEFTGGNGEPNKSQLVLLQTRVETSESDQGSNVSIITTDNPSNGIVYDIVKLSSDDLKLVINEVVSFGGGSRTNEQAMVFRKRS